ncbi:MAG: efflux RND transporter periplasmic adaptor subunit [Alphaproteobacteria bacterium]|nr:MAG: efflux RND transporter periplasmic adaptor subunit [Alphaproteobacteria bacterium]
MPARRRGAGVARARALALAVLALALPLVAAAPAPAAEAPRVRVTEARPAEIAINIPVTGTLVAREEVMVNPRVAGRIIMALHADVGDAVDEGALLAELDRDSLEVQLAQAEAELARAKAAVKQAASQVELAQANFDNAATNYERNRKLRESGTISQASVDQSETAYQTARASLSAAQDGLAVANAQVRQAEAQLRMARLNLGYTRITAPVDGIIAARNARLGAVAVAGAQPMFSIIAHGEVEAEVEVLETEVAQVSLGDRVTLNIAGIGETEGKVRLVPPSVDARTRLAKLRIALPGVDGLRTGSFARGLIEARRYTALTVPVSAILSDGDGDFVLLLGKDDILERRDVKAGAVWAGRREIVSGLDEGDRVVLRAGPFFQSGDKVIPVLEGAAGGESDQ